MCFYSKKWLFVPLQGCVLRFFAALKMTETVSKTIVKNIIFPLSRNRKIPSVILLHPRDGVTLILRRCKPTYLLTLNNLYTLWNSRVFSSERKVTPIYTILMRSVLHIYAVGLYNYAFHPFSVTSSPVRVHTLYCPCAHPVIVCLKKLRRPCAHG